MVMQLHLTKFASQPEVSLFITRSLLSFCACFVVFFSLSANDYVHIP